MRDDKSVSFLVEVQMLKDAYKRKEIDEKTYNEAMKKACSKQEERREKLRIEEDLNKAVDENDLAKVYDIVEKDIRFKEGRAECCVEPLIKAARKGSTEIVRALMINGAADENMQDEEGKIPLMYAAQNGHMEAVKVLTTAEANLNIQDKEGKTALMYAAENGRLKVAELLLALGADLSIVDKKGQNALDFAQTNGQTEVEKLIKEAMTQKRGPQTSLDAVLTPFLASRINPVIKAGR